MLRIDPASPVRPYRQLRDQLHEQIRDGHLAPGTQLPPVRRLASDLGLAPNTVARTYRELEAAGLAEGRGRKGTVVRGITDSAPRGEQAAELTREYLRAMSALGLSHQEIIGQVRASASADPT